MVRREEGLCKRTVEWKIWVENKGLKVNTAKTKVKHYWDKQHLVAL